MVLRPADPLEAAPLLERLRGIGLRHVEIAWQPHPAWPRRCRRLVEAFPELRLGAASVCTPAALADCRAAGLGYAVSPVLDRALLRSADDDGFALVPGVLTPSEVHAARRSSSLVKLFPAAAVGAGYWRSLRAPLGGELPFCIAAGGLGPQDVLRWLEAGVDAVTLGARLLEAGDGPRELERLLPRITP